MEAGLVSVVLPIYNVEKYLDRCIESVVKQTYSNLEIILVDDGSPDGCPQKCEEWAKKDSRIKVIHKANAGLGYARNTGIENASGEYICFFDSDDYVAPGTIEKAYTTAKTDISDIVLFGHYAVDAYGKIIKTHIPSTKKESYEGSEVQDAYWVVIIGMYPKARTVCILKYPIDGPIPFLRFCFSRHDFFRRNRMVIVRSAHIALNSA